MYHKTIPKSCTRNTLSFATRAKEVINTARVNMVVSDKRLVRQLQKEVVRLEGELRSPEQSPSHACLRSLLAKKELKIRQMEKEMEELRRQRDLAQTQLDLERRATKVQKGSNDWEVLGRQALVKKLLASPPGPPILVDEIQKLEHRQLQLCEDANRALEVLHKDFATHNLGNQRTFDTMSKVLCEIKDLVAASSTAEEIMNADKAILVEKISQFEYQVNTIASLERKLDNVQKSIDKLVSAFATEEETTPESKSQLQLRKKTIRLPSSPLSSSHKAMEQEIENMVPYNNNIISLSASDTCARKENGGFDSVILTPTQEGSPASRQSKSVNVKKIEKMFKNAVEDHIRSFGVYITELKEILAKLHFQKELLVSKVLELEVEDSNDAYPLPWEKPFEEKREQIIMLWHLCHVSIVHRTQIYLLFLLNGDPSDQVYMEVELGILIWLDQKLSELGNASPALLGDEPATYVSASTRSLKQERENLAEKVSTKLTALERKLVYAKWQVPPLGKGKQRSLQLVNKLWTDPYNMQHVQESAYIVAKLIDFSISDENIKNMFGLNFSNPFNKKTWAGWNFISNLLNF